MAWFKSKDLLDRTFEIGIILKGLAAGRSKL